MRRRAAGRVSLATSLTLLALLATGVGLLAMALYVGPAMEEQAVEVVRRSLAAQGRLLQDVFAPRLASEPAGGPRTGEVQRLAEQYAARLGARVTVIARDGTVLGESDVPAPGEIESHATRAEVREALAGRVGSARRRSATVGRDLLYVAVPLETPGRVAGVVRLALPTPEVTRATGFAWRTAAAGAFLAFTLALAIGLLVSRRVARPVRRMREAADRMAAGDLERVVPVSGADEIAGLGEALNRMAVALREKIAALAVERARASAVLDSMVEGVLAVDARGRVVLANPAARALLGAGPDPVEGRPLVEVSRHTELSELVEAARADGLARREIALGLPLARVLAGRASALSLGEPGAGVLLVLHDVTDVRRLERVRTEFVANVSHELRTPLTCIKGYLETLLDGALDEPEHARRFLEIASTHAERLGRLVDDLLELSNIETGRVTLVPAPVELRAVAAGVSAMFEGRALRQGVGLDNAVPAGLRATADRDRLVQILVNLVDNAVKFTPAGGRVTLAARPVDPARVEVRVTDTGVGIPSTDLPRITERFYRVDRARSRELGGTGLGLAIVKHLVQAHGGELRIESLVGRGTTVAFTLPAS